ncbi:Uncharacterised protein [Klebsiella pneumoniae]|nr:Uncharacterised protein [Klebsiella pneumoniae]
MFVSINLKIPNFGNVSLKQASVFMLIWNLNVL